jgi:hypothetical protein
MNFPAPKGRIATHGLLNLQRPCQHSRDGEMALLLAIAKARLGKA